MQTFVYTYKKLSSHPRMYIPYTNIIAYYYRIERINFKIINFNKIGCLI